MSNICIFYDLETTDKNAIGQIINLSFIVTDHNFNVLEEFARDIKIGRLQLPSAGAILANRTNVTEHQKTATKTEREALFELWTFLDSQIKKHKLVTLVGFNNLGFDQNFLRTSFIRNGLNPYYPRSKVNEADLFLLTQYLSLTDGSFPRPKSKKLRKDGKIKLSLSLEAVTTELNLLTGKQTHQSRDDVLLTIELARTYKEKFNQSIIDFNPYQAGKIHEHESIKGNRGSVINLFEPEYDLLKSETISKTPYMFLDSNYRYSIWADLNSFEKGHKSLRMCKIDQGAFFTDCELIEDPKILELSKLALKKYEKVTAKNYFGITECDIEQFIYRIDFDHIAALNKVIWQGERADLKMEDAKKILGRYRLANYELNGKQEDVYRTRLKNYALYRYGGNLRFDKGMDTEDKILERTPRAYTHPTFNELIAEIDSAKKDASKDDETLLGALKDFYYQSEIYQLAGKELEGLSSKTESLKVSDTNEIQSGAS